MLVPTSVTTRLTSRLAVSFPTVGPPSPLHQDACSIIQNGYECFHFQAGLACIHQDEVSETTSVAIAETIDRVLPFGLRRRPARPLGAHGPSREVRSGLPRPHRPLRGPRGKIPNGRSRGTAAPCPTARTGSRACSRASAVVSPPTRPSRRAVGLRAGGSARRDLPS